MLIGIIGAGNMGEAILAALLRKNIVKPGDVLLSDPRSERLQELRQRYGVRTARDNRDVSSRSDVLLLGVKPQQLDAVLRDLQTAAAPRGLVISIAPGKRLAWIEQRLPAARVVRVMPNIACRAGAAMSVFCMGSKTSDNDRQTAEKLLTSFGRALELPEKHMDVVTAVCGSGPAFFARMAQAMAAAADGITPEQALLLVAQTMQGTSSLLLDKIFSPAELIAAVSSARGVTVAGLDTMDRLQFDETVAAAIAAAARRSRELAEPENHRS